jgi:hypothetical protein
MIIYEKKDYWLNPLYLILKGFLMLWNPSPRKIKIQKKGGGYLLDIRGKRLSKKIQSQELARRRANGEEERKCYSISPRGSTELYGSTK